MRHWWGLPAVLVDEGAVSGVSAHPDRAPKMGLWVRCLQVMVRLGLDTRSNESVPVWRAPEGPEGLAVVPVGGGVWPDNESTRRAKRAARTARGRAAAHGAARPHGRAIWHPERQRVTSGR